MVTQGNFQWKNGIKDTEVIFYPNKDGRFYITWVPNQQSTKQYNNKEWY